jgi:Matrixin
LQAGHKKDPTPHYHPAGVDTSSLNDVNIAIADLGGTTLGLAFGHTITLDDNAAGWGWFVDATPNNDSEFTTAGNQGEQQRIDLLTVVMHELGHLLGRGHDANGVMAETLAAGVRRTDLEHDDAALADQVFSKSDDDRPDVWLGNWWTEQLESHRPWAKRRS